MQIRRTMAIGAACLLLVLGQTSDGARATPKTAASSQPTGTTDDVEDIEEVDAVVVTPVKKDPASVFGKLHPMAVHMPMGWLLLLLLVELAALRWQRLAEAGLPLAALTLAAFAPAIITGLVRAEDVTPSSGLLDHRNMMFGAAATLVAATALRVFWRARLEGLRRGAYILLLLAASMLMTVGGHLGGKLVFGDAYLPF